MLKRLQQKTHELNTQIFALYLAYKDKRVAWYARVLIAITLVYAISPIDLVPDFIPVFGYLDDLIVLPAGAYLSLSLIPKDVMNQCQARAIAIYGRHGKGLTSDMQVVVIAWLLFAALAFMFVYKFMTPDIF
ncbi:MAG: DUF1232 domain-containing protein [Hymenobacteraceae bacterium]|nr:DUF1232 domain-containing protein [Hymenobacteraceae bacterium]MDX5395549.1 DUF1232 domain-containing protein [Hymenobacteraceae bacterium]MDX5443036.1 DUF1232 domain-containing protein [Hymenobacteraceae bacterium]MDX5511603.1 DUF1232 domain-containing protein [Hymenobacteraceae bacterium]